MTLIGYSARAQVPTVAAFSEPVEVFEAGATPAAPFGETVTTRQTSFSTEPDCTYRVREEQAPGDLPDAPSTYSPLSSHCKFELFLRQTHSSYTLASAAFEASWAHAWGQWPEYGGGMQGWAKRLGTTFADTESRRFIQTFVLSSVFHQDPRYFPSGKKKLAARAWYAVTRVLVTRGDDGSSEFNTSEFLGALSTSALQNTYYPRPYRTAVDTMNRFGGALGSDATTGLLHEFAPDLKRMFHKYAPQKIRKLGERFPALAEDSQP